MKGPQSADQEFSGFGCLWSRSACVCVTNRGRHAQLWAGAVPDAAHRPESCQHASSVVGGGVNEGLVETASKECSGPPGEGGHACKKDQGQLLCNCLLRGADVMLGNASTEIHY